MEAEIVGPDPGYVSCSRFLTQAAFSVLKIGPRFAIYLSGVARGGSEVAVATPF